MSGQNSKYEEMNPFDQLPNEMIFEIFSCLDMTSFLEVRRVSKQWKVIADGSRKLVFTCRLTDKTLQDVVNSNENISGIELYNFSGAGNKTVSLTRGTGRIFRNAETISLIGSKINEKELMRMMQYAIDSVKDLQFHYCHPVLMKSLLGLNKRPFQSLNSLTLIFRINPTIGGETSILQTLDSPLKAQQLQSLQHLNISYELRGDWYRLPSGIQLYENYLAAARLVLRFRGTLKTLQIGRNTRLRQCPYFDVDNIELTPLQRDQIQECLAGLNEVQLDSLEICSLVDEGNFPWVLERRLTLQQQNLKKLIIENDYNDNEDLTPFQSLTSLFPANCHLLTDIQLSVWASPGRDPVDLSIFSQCPGLKSLWLWFNVEIEILSLLEQDRLSIVYFTNLDRLPKGITSVHLKPSSESGIIHHISLDQIRWMVANLKDLEYIGLQIITADQYHNYDDEDGVNHQEEVNIDARTFEDLISMRKLRSMQLDMMKLEAYFNVRVNDLDEPVLPIQRILSEDIDEYIIICEQNSKQIDWNHKGDSGNYYGDQSSTIIRLTIV